MPRRANYHEIVMDSILKNSNCCCNKMKTIYVIIESFMQNIFGKNFARIVFI